MKKAGTLEGKKKKEKRLLLIRRKYPVLYPSLNLHVLAKFICYSIWNWGGGERGKSFHAHKIDVAIEYIDYTKEPSEYRH